MFLWFLLGCAPNSSPAWAIDPWWAEPTSTGGLHGFQTWMLYGKGYSRARSDRSYACGVVVELTGVPTDPCPGCTAAWSVTAEVAEHDCDAPWDDEPAWTSLRAVGLGAVGADIAADDPHPGASMGGFGDYGDGWLAHGWAWPEAVDAGAPPAEWDRASPVVFWPAWAWDL